MLRIIIFVSGTFKVNALYQLNPPPENERISQFKDEKITFHLNQTCNKPAVNVTLFWKNHKGKNKFINGHCLGTDL